MARGKKIDAGGKHRHKVNTIQHGQGEKNRRRGKTLTQRERICSPSTPPVKVEQLIA